MDHDSESSEGSAEARRLRRVERRWNAAQVEITSNRWWRTWERTQSDLLVGATLAFVLLPLDTAILGLDVVSFGDVLRSLPESAFRIWGAVVVVGNALLIDALVAWRRPDNPAVKVWVRLLSFALGGVPLLGFYVIHFWQWILARRPPWAFAAVRGETDGKSTVPRSSLSRATAELLGSRASAALAILWLHGGNLVLLFVWSFRLSSPRTLSGIVVHVMLHVLVFCCLIDYLRLSLRKYTVEGWQRALLWLLPPLSLPFALGGAGGLLWYEARKRETLCGNAYFNPGGVSRLASWAHLQYVLDQSAGILRNRLRTEGVGRSETSGRVGRRLTAVYRLKTFLLGIDALALGWLFGRSPELVLIAWALVGAGAALLLAVSRTLVRSLRPSRPTWLDAHAYGGLLALGLVFAVTGLCVGAWLRQGRAQQAGLLVMYLIALGAMFAGFAIIIQPFLRRFDLHRENRHDDAGWVVLFFALMILGGLMAIDEDRARACAGVLVAVAVLSPVWHVALAVAFQGWLLRPCRLRMLLGGRYPRRLTWRLAFLLTTLALPLGGVAVPGWIFMRHRWPSHEPRVEEG